MKLLLAFFVIFTYFSIEVLSQDIDPNSFDFDFDFGFDETTPEFEYTTLDPELLFPENEKEPETTVRPTERSVEVFSEWPVSATGDKEIEESEEDSRESTTLKPAKDIPTVKSTTRKPTTLKPTTSKPTTPKPTTPKSTTPKSTTPKSTTPKSTTPEATTPRSTTPRSTTPRSTTPRSTTPRSTTPRLTTPRSTTPRSTTPRSTTMKPTTPKTTTTTTEKTTTEDNTTEEEEVTEFPTDEQSENDDDTELHFIGEKIPIPDETETPVRPVLRIPNDIMDIFKSITDCCTDESSEEEESPWTAPEQPIEPQIKFHVKTIPLVPVAKKCYHQLKAGPNNMNGDSVYGRILNGISVQRCYHCCETSTYRQCSFTYARDCFPSVVNIQEQTPYYQRGRGIIRISNWG